MIKPNNKQSLITLAALLIIGLYWHSVLAATPVVEIEIKEHLFHPSEIVVPANTKIKLVFNNLDATPEEFESYELNREKVINGGRKAVIFIGPLAPGKYPFFGEFYPKTARGTILVE